ncbi:MAG: arylesterase [Gammaproteobacteria bacterium]|nr:arylesterase [Gammaproteobacteria bacterium]
MAAVLLLAGCGSSTPALAPLPADAVILAFGDSLTAGTGADTSSGYPAVLAREAGRRVINAGVPGEESAAGLVRLPRVLDETSPDLMILCHGGNDLLRKRGVAQLKRNVGAMIALAQQRNIAVVLVGVPAPRVLLSIEPLYLELAEEYGVPLERKVLPLVLRKAELKSDPVHPNAAGYATMAERLGVLLREAGAL